MATSTPAPTSTTSAPATTTPAPAAEAPRLLVLDLAPRDVDENVARLATGILSATADEDGRFTVDTVADLRAMANLEGAKAQLGCDVDSCLAEMAQAMGSRFVFHGDIGALGGLLVVNLSLYDAESARSVARRSLQAENPAALPGVLKPAIASMLALAAPAGAARFTSSADVKTDAMPLVRPATIVVGAGGALALVGGAIAGVAEWNVGRKPAAGDDRGNLPLRNLGLGALAGCAVGVATASVGAWMMSLEHEGAQP